MENTIENKKKFFAQYFDVPCIENQDWIWRNNSRLSELPYGSDLTNAYMFLKPISETSKEDLIFISKINGYENDQLYYGKKIISGYANLLIETNIGYMHTVDFLRSKGYALPWMGLSVDKQFEYGWIKLNSKTN